MWCYPGPLQRTAHQKGLRVSSRRAPALASALVAARGAVTTAGDLHAARVGHEASARFSLEVILRSARRAECPGGC